MTPRAHVLGFLGPLTLAAFVLTGCGASDDCNADRVTTFVMRANPFCHNAAAPAPDEGEDAAKAQVCIANASDTPCEKCVRAHCCSQVLAYSSCKTNCTSAEQAATACEAKRCAGFCP